MTYIALLAFVVLAALGQLGIQTTSFIAIIGAAGLAIGLALQASLSNFTAGFLMILFRPFKVGDYMKALGLPERLRRFRFLPPS
jgi:small conductance mechanosensitive channel